MAQNRKRSIFSARYDDFKAYLFSCKPSARRRNQVRQALIAFVDYLAAEGYRRDNPARELPRLKVGRSIPKTLPSEAGEILWAEAKARHPKVTALIGLYLWGALRKSEARYLRWDQVEFDQIRVEGKGTGRKEGRGKDRIIPMHPELDWALRRWRRECPDPNWVFPSPRETGRPVSASWIVNRIRELGESTGVELHPHLLRHMAATELLERGGDIIDAQALLGHSNLATTSVYLHARPARLKNAVKRMTFREADE